MRFSSLLVVIIFSLIFPVNLFAQEPLVGQTIYVVTNIDLERSQLVELDISNSHTRVLLDLPYVSDKPVSEEMPDSEMNWLKNTAGDEKALEKSQETLNQTLRRVWSMSKDKLLLETEYSTCVSLLDYICFGFYEYDIFDLQNNTYTFLSKINFHGTVHDVKSGVACSLRQPIPATTVKIYSLRFIVLEVEPIIDCLIPQTTNYIPNPSDIYTILINITNLNQPSTLKFENITGVSIDPNGDNIFGYQISDCNTDGCRATAGIAPIDNFAKLSSVKSDKMQLRQFIFLESLWLSSDEVIYKWSDAIYEYGLYEYEISQNQTYPLIDSQWETFIRFEGTTIGLGDKISRLDIRDQSVDVQPLGLDDGLRIIDITEKQLVFADEERCISKLYIYSSEQEVSVVELGNLFTDSCVTDLSVAIE